MIRYKYRDRSTVVIGNLSAICSTQKLKLRYKVRILSKLGLFAEGCHHRRLGFGRNLPQRDRCEAAEEFVKATVKKAS